MPPEDARNQLFAKAAEHWHVSPDEMETKNGMIWPKNRPEEKLPWVMAVPFAWQAHGVGHYYHDYSKSNFCIYFAEVSVDLDTGDARLENVAVGSDVSQVIDPATLETQFHGGFGAACADTGLMEENVIDRPTGRAMSGSMSDYKWRPLTNSRPSTW